MTFIFNTDKMAFAIIDLNITYNPFYLFFMKETEKMKKRYMIFIMIILMFSVLSACGNLENESGKPSIANVGDVLDEPEKTVSLESLDEITVDSIAQNDEIEYSFLISVDYDGENTRYYDKLRYRSEDGQININEDRKSVV